ncbi:exosortase A [Roseococcus pinisoli]|uniref:Exosortase n=1 Tax=Roseococcus pinisoli TaxID=2835040 RepID=A0ABS5QEQ3_9PROT|nr:exosortase [Roseococcus pinisoli]
MSTARPTATLVPDFSGWETALAAMAIGLGALGVLFWPEVAAAVSTWDRSSAYGHCWLILPIAAWLAWSRRHRLAGLSPEPLPLAGLLAIGGAAAWFVAERLGIMEGRQFAALGLVWVLVLATLGWRVSWAMAAPLGYLVFLVPFGEFATPWLQDITLDMILFGLRIFGIPHHADGLTIDIPAGTFLVAEACAGLRFLIAAMAFGTLYALCMFRSPWRRLMVMLLAVVVPVIANGIRALAIVLMGHYMGSAEAAAADHVIYGWGFFSLVMVLLIVAGLPFRQDAEPAVPASVQPIRPAAPPRLAAALVIAVGLAALGPVAARALDASVPPPVAETIRLAAPAGCEAGGEALLCPGASLSASVIAFAPGTNWSAVANARRQAAGADDEALIFDVVTPAARWQVRQGQLVPGAVAMAAWLDGAPAGNGVSTRARQAWNSLRGHGGKPVLAIVSLVPNGPLDPARMRLLMQAVLGAQHDGLVQRAAHLSAF